MHNAWPDPKTFKTVEEFHKHYAEEYGKAKAYESIILALGNAGFNAQNIAKQMSVPNKDYTLGTNKHEK